MSHLYLVAGLPRFPQRAFPRYCTSFSSSYYVELPTLAASLCLVLKLTMTTQRQYRVYCKQAIPVPHRALSKRYRLSFTSMELSSGWWCSGIYPDLLCRRSGVQFPDPPTVEECSEGSRLCNLLRSTQPNDREIVIEG